MARKPVIRELNDSKLASTYGGWIYCGRCGENIGYLCYVTYDNFKFHYTCRCGGVGSVHLAFDDVAAPSRSEEKLAVLKNRFCCPTDASPLMTILEKKLVSYTCEIDCVSCSTRYAKEKTE